MARKKKQFTAQQQADMARAGLDWRYFELVYEAPQSLMVRHRETNQTMMVRRSQNPGCPGFRIPN